MRTARAAALYQQAAVSTHPWPLNALRGALSRVGAVRFVDAICPDAPRRRQPNDLAINAPLLPSLATRTSALGLGFGDRFGGCQGRSGSFKEMVQQAEKPRELQGKHATKRLLRVP
jgi:hypothetical protein